MFLNNIHLCICKPLVITNIKTIIHQRKLITNYTHLLFLFTLSLAGYEPFCPDNESEVEMFKKILKANYQFHTPFWNEISENAKVTYYVAML
jgi:hypothetical protein